MTRAAAETRAGVVETHVSVLFFVGERVYKARKPVRYDFVDFTSREVRARDCEREVVLNRPYAPDVYLGVYDLVDAEGAPVDHLVVLRRLPSERRLSVLVGEGRALPADIRSIVERVCAVDRSAARSVAIERHGRADALLERWRADGEELARHLGEGLDRGRDRRIQELAAAYLEGRRPLLEARIASGRVRDGHGDLRAEDVYCLEDGCRILDCVEFDARLRAVDIVSDLAFLLMDLEQLGAGRLGLLLRESYQEHTGDAAPASLWWHYAAAHAYVRAKVACLSAEAGLADGGAAAALHALAERLLRRARVRLVLVGGLPGSGKTTLSRSLASALDAELLHSDEVRKSLADADALDGADLYSEAATAATYEALVGRAGAFLAGGRSVVLDATWHAAARRAAARRIADLTASELVELECTAPEALRERRLLARRPETAGASDATVAVGRALASNFDPWPEAVAVDASGAPGRTLELARSLAE